MVIPALAAALLLATLCLVLAGAGQQGTTIALRATALLAFPFLVGAYAGPALALLRPGRLGDWLLVHRRSLGLAFAAVIAVHLALIIHLLTLPPDPSPKLLGLTPGFLTYLVLGAMVLTSFRVFTRVIGPTLTRQLLRLGPHLVFAVFTVGLFKGVFVRHYYAWWLLPLIVALAVYAVRFGAWRASSPR